jgi:hypothetical protein
LYNQSTNQPNYMEQSPCCLANTCSASQEIPAFYGTRRFITVLTRTRHCSLSWTRWIQFTPSQHISLLFVLILSFHLRLRLRSGLFRSGFRTKILYVFLISPTCATCPPLSSSLRSYLTVHWTVHLTCDFDQIRYEEPKLKFVRELPFGLVDLQ